MQERSLALEDLGHVSARAAWRTRGSAPKKISNLQNACASHVSSKPLRPKQRVNQVDKQPHRGDACNDVVHELSS